MELKIKRKNTLQKISGWLLALGLFLAGFGGAFLPWVWREAVALQLTAPGLAEFVKFLPEVRAVQIQIERLYFLLPLFTAILILPISVENRAVAVILPLWLRLSLRLSVIPMALASLSPVWTPQVLISREFRLQTMLAIIAVCLAFVAPLLKDIPLQIIAVILVLVGTAAIILPTYQFNLIQQAMINIYNEPVYLGWGWWLTVAGFVLSVVSGGVAAFLANKP